MYSSVQYKHAASVARPSTTGSWLFSYRPDSRAKLRLFCFPYAGGGPKIYSKWSQSLPSSVELALVQFPGRGNRFSEPLITNLPDLVRALAQGLRPYFDKPFVFFGHSMGALLSFELARHIRKEFDLLPMHLFVSGRVAPNKIGLRRALHALPEPEFLEELRSLNGTPKEVLDAPELLQLVIPVLRADFAVNETYVYLPERSLDCPITAFGGLQDDSTNHERLEAWQEHTTAGFVLRMLPGDHFYINSAQELLLGSLYKDLEKLAIKTT